MEFTLIFFCMMSAGLLLSFFSSVLNYMSVDYLRENSKETKEDIFEKLHKYKARYETHSDSFNILEIILYLASSSGLGILFFQNTDLGIVFSILVTMGIFLTFFFLRLLVYFLGKRYANNVAISSVSMLGLINLVSGPLRYLSHLFERSIGGKQVEEAPLEEIDAIVETAHEEGSLDKDEYRLLKNLIHFSEVHVSDVMTPRTVMFTCEAGKKIADLIVLPELKMYSRFPVWEGESLENGVLGYVMTKDVLHAALQGKSEQDLKAFIREIEFIPEFAELDKALARFLERRQHMLLVVDEYGGIEGLLTMEDVLETILGAEIVDEADKIVDMRELAKQKRDKRVLTMKNP